VLSAATIRRSRTTITGTLSGNADASFRIEFFSNPAGTSQGKGYLGFIRVTTDGTGLASFAFSSSSLVACQNVTATAMGQTGNTSEFSAAVNVRS